MPRPALSRTDADGLTLVRFERGRVGAHLALIRTPSHGTDVEAALQAATGRPLRSIGLPGGVLRLRPDRPDLARLDWRPGHAVEDDAGALARLSPFLRGPGLAGLLRDAGALDSGIAVLSPPARRGGEWTASATHHPDALADALVAALTGRYPRGAYARLGIEAGDPPHPGDMRKDAVHVSPALRAALSDAIETEAGGDGLDRLVSATRPAHRRPGPRALVDADLPDAVRDGAIDGLPIHATLAAEIARLGLSRVGDLVGLPLHRVMRPGLTPARIEALRAAIDDLAVVRTPAAAPAAASRPVPPATVPRSREDDAPAPPSPGGSVAAAGDGGLREIPELPVLTESVAEGGRVPTDAVAVLPLLESLVDAMSERHRTAMRAYLGFGGAALVMHEAAGVVGYAPERIRQISMRMFEAFVADPRGLAVRERLCEALAETPMRLDALAVEPWAAGMPPGMVEAIVRRLPGHPLQVTVDDETDETLVTPMSSSGWNAAIRDGRQALARLRPGLDRTAMARAVMHDLIGLPEHYQACVIARLLPPGFVPPVPATRIVLEAILSDARRGMTLEEIIDAYSALAGRPPIWSQINHALYGIAVRGADRRYTLKVVFEPDVRLGAIAEDCRRVIRRGGQRHWTLPELREALPRRHRPVLEALEDRGLDAVLMADRRFLRLKGGLWLLRGKGARDGRPRIDSWAEAILERTGGPMSGKALMDEVARTRGTIASTQLRERGRMVRVAPALWGLHDRDLGLDAAEVSRIQDLAERAVDAGPVRLAALHAALAAEIPPCVTATVLGSLLNLREGGARVDRHGDAILPRDRGLGAGKFQKAIFAAARETTAVEDVIRTVRRSVGRTPSYQYVVRTAKEAGIHLDRATPGHPRLPGL